MAQKQRRSIDDQIKALMDRKNKVTAKQQAKKEIEAHKAAIAKLRGRK